jgi:hypothetical protein
LKKGKTKPHQIANQKQKKNEKKNKMACSAAAAAEAKPKEKEGTTEKKTRHEWRIVFDHFSMDWEYQCTKCKKTAGYMQDRPAATDCGDCVDDKDIEKQKHQWQIVHDHGLEEWDYKCINCKMWTAHNGPKPAPTDCGPCPSACEQNSKPEQKQEHHWQIVHDHGLEEWDYKCVHCKQWTAHNGPKPAPTALGPCVASRTGQS